MEEMEDNRVRLKFSTKANGEVQKEITVEFPTVEESAKNMGEAIDAFTKVLADKGLKEATGK